MATALSRGVGDQRTVIADERVHPAERVLPVILAEIAMKRLDQQLVCAVQGLAVEVAGVD